MSGRLEKTFEVATGGHPQRALSEFLLVHVERGTLGMAAVAHDDECPCGTEPDVGMERCTCEIVEVTVTEVRP